MKTRNQQGFTLIELLVVLAIIGILAALILSNLATARKKARDARRKTDVRALAAAIEMWSGDNQYLYPPAETTGVPVNFLTPGSDINTALSNQNYIKQIPADPINSGNQIYYYNSNTEGTDKSNDYAFFAKLEAGASDAQYFCATSGASGLITLDATPAAPPVGGLTVATCIPS